MIKDSASKLTALRTQIKAHDLDGYLVPQTDAYQNEFVPVCYQRLPWLTGFTGSAGMAVILHDQAVVMTDGRYTIQVREEVDPHLYATADSVKTNVATWLKTNAKNIQKLGYDPQLFTFEQIEKLNKDVSDTDIELVSVSENLIDKIWENRPQKPDTQIEIFPHHIAGFTTAQKLDFVAETITAKKADACFISAPESVCWLLNVRAQDTPCTPLVLSEVLVRRDGSALWFIDGARVTDDIRAHIGDRVQALNDKPMDQWGGKVLLDFKRSAIAWKARLENAGCIVKNMKDPCIDRRACKTISEIDSLKTAHKIDAIAVTALLDWIEENQKKAITELDIVAKIDDLRRAHPTYRGESFNSIVGAGSNGAIIHYRPSVKTNRTIEQGTLLLIDSGGQYAKGDVYGTTDITRTIAIGPPTDEMREMYTRVLKGHIAVAQAVFSPDTTGKDIDARARQYLREVEKDYPHGTGHGVGCYLSVHEEATSLSSRSEDTLKPGMLLSNEPGYYKEGAYGIRLENLVLVTEKTHNMLGFETISFAPFDERLIVSDMLNAQEHRWLTAYHEACEN
jgi:Xaa-Pro aminopeptidase